MNRKVKDFLKKNPHYIPIPNFTYQVSLRGISRMQGLLKDSKGYVDSMRSGYPLLVVHHLPTDPGEMEELEIKMWDTSSDEFKKKMYSNIVALDMTGSFPKLVYFNPEEN